MRLILFLSFCLLVSSCDKRPATWTAFVYPIEGSEDGETIRTGLVSEKVCLDMAGRMVSDLKSSGFESAYFKCGYRCAYEPERKTHVCKTIVK